MRNVGKATQHLAGLRTLGALGTIALAGLVFSGCLMTRTGKNSLGNISPYSILDVGLGANTTCVIVQKNFLFEQRLQCLGSNTNSVFSNTSPSRDYFSFGRTADQAFLGNIFALSLGGNTGCATQNGRPVCWGDNLFGAAGQQTGEASVTYAKPILENLPGTTLSIAVSPESSCAIQTTSSGNRVYCWGDPDLGRLGDGTQAGPATLTNLKAVEIDGAAAPFPQFGDPNSGTGSPVQMTASSSGHCAVTDQGSVWCWGPISPAPTNSYRANRIQTGISPYTSDLVGAVKVVTGRNHACAMTNESIGKVYCWGSNDVGQTGRGFTSALSTEAIPDAVKDLPTPIFDIAATSNSTCAIAGPLRSIYCWGGNIKQELGIGTDGVTEWSCTLTYAGSGIQVGGGTGPTSPTEVGKACVPLASPGVPGGALRIWGSNEGSHFCATYNDGTLRCWGDNMSSQLGDALNPGYPSYNNSSPNAVVLDFRMF